jgi:hypothetical protein
MRDAIDMAREAGIIDFRDAFSEEHVQAVLQDLKAFEALVRADESEVCAQVVEEYPHWLGMTAKAEIANAIRNRRNT